MLLKKSGVNYFVFASSMSIFEKNKLIKKQTSIQQIQNND